VTIEQALGLAVADAARGVVTVPEDLQGFPGTAHGGAVAALCYRLTLPRPPVELRLALHRGVPTGTPLRLRTASQGATAELALLQDGRVLAEATLRRGERDRPDGGPLREAWTAAQTTAEALPRTRSCLACGSTNPVGLDLRLVAAPAVLGQEYEPRPAYRTRAGVHPALAFVALDELGWWLGALAQGECGVTTELHVRLFRWLPDAPLLILGDRTAVSLDDPRGRYRLTRGLLLDPAGEVLAAADVRFAASRAYTRRLLEPFLAATDPDRLARWFPGVRTLAGRPEAD
jgi:hypothetical protein